MKNVWFILCLLTGFETVHAQYYYRDVVVTAQISRNYQLLRENKVNRIQVTPFQGSIPVTEGVQLEQMLVPGQNMLITHSKAANAPESWLKSYYNNQGLLIRSTDSTEELITRTIYDYDAQQRVTRISSTMTPANNPVETEVHIWSYNPSGTPASMIKVKNGSDTSYVKYEADEQGNAGEEHVTRKGNKIATTFYYYNAAKQLTDVARYNRRADKVLPDYMFEYTESGQVSQMIVVPEGTADYQIWRYIYNAQGLKEKEICYNKQKQLVGKVEYAYQ